MVLIGTLRQRFILPYCLQFYYLHTYIYMNEALAKLTRKYCKLFGYNYKNMKKVVKMMNWIERSKYSQHLKKYLPKKV